VRFDAHESEEATFLIQYTMINEKMY